MIRPVNDDNSHCGVLQRRGCCQATKTSAHDHNTWEILGTFAGVRALERGDFGRNRHNILLPLLTDLLTASSSQPNYDGMTISRSFRLWS
jgi:hypothetical protein